MNPSEEIAVAAVNQMLTDIQSKSDQIVQLTWSNAISAIRLKALEAHLRGRSTFTMIEIELWCSELEEQGPEPSDPR